MSEGLTLPRRDVRLANALQADRHDLTDHYVDVLRTLGKQPGLLGDIFAGAQSRFNNPVNLKKMLTLINETRVD